jgi:hypothetical protein
MSELYTYRDPVTGLFGFENESGDIIIAARFLKTSGFSEGLAAVQEKSELWSYINEEGEVEFPFTASVEHAFQFSEGRAVIIRNTYLIADDQDDEDEVLDPRKPNKIHTIIDKKGRYLLDVHSVDSRKYSEGLLPVKFRKNDDYSVYIDPDGKPAIEGPFKFGFPFGEGKALVQWETDMYQVIDIYKDPYFEIFIDFDKGDIVISFPDMRTREEKIAVGKGIAAIGSGQEKFKEDVIELEVLFEDSDKRDFQVFLVIDEEGNLVEKKEKKKIKEKKNKK